jgi:predicted nucleotidyltransferase
MGTPGSLSPIVEQDLSKATAILKRYGATEVYLFGSYASGTARSESDIDIAAVGLPKNRFFAAYGELLMELQLPFDLIGLDYDNDVSRDVRTHAELVRVG